MSEKSVQRQAVMLREMGITPLWRRRLPAAADAVIAATPSKEAVVAPAPQAKAEETAPMADAAQPIVREPGLQPVAVSGEVAAMDWPALRQCVAACTACALHKTRNQTVFGVGDEQADWLFVGEGPGADEDAQGEPFVGQAGKLLDNMLAAIEMNRHENVYIANVLKCRPPGNRNPEPHEVAQCDPFLKRQIALLQPRVVVVMGRFAAQSLLGTDASIASLRGRVHEIEVGARRLPVIVTYHPAYLLRNLADKAKSWADLCLARQVYQRG